MLVSYTFSRKLISQISNNVNNHSGETNPIKRWAMILNREFSKEKRKISKKYLKKYMFTSIAVEKYIKMILRFHISQNGRKIKKTTEKNTLDNSGKGRAPIHCYCHYVDCCSHYENYCAEFSKD